MHIKINKRKDRKLDYLKGSIDIIIELFAKNNRQEGFTDQFYQTFKEI